MALYEERDMQAQHTWRDHFARERRVISESVEETLADTASQEVWTDNEYNDERDERSATNTSLVPPRLSLQSKALSSVRSATFVQSVTAELAAQKATPKAREERQKPQSTGIFARFAQHFTSSIAAFGSAIQPATPERVSTYEKESQMEERHLVSHTPIYPIASNEMQKASPVSVIDAIPATPAITSVSPIRSKQRLAGHTSKIRLQTAPAPRAIARPGERQLQEWNRERQEPLREPLTVNVSFREMAQEMPYDDAIVGITPYEEKQTLPPSRVEKSRLSDGEFRCASFFGTGAFENGQGELMVRNARTTASSVVHVTLTSKPGPTLVQYVSLHPEVGFTLHLTAPVAAKTSFNYVLLVDVSV